MEIVIELLVMVAALIAFAIWRIGQIVSWRALARMALATGSFEICVAYIRFCAQHERF